MNSLKRQDGSGLILVIGITAALAIMAIALVTLTANVQSNTADLRTKDKSFAVAEAGVDGMMFVLGSDWPDAEEKGPNTGTTGETTWDAQAALLRTQGTYADTDEYPAPATGHGAFVTAVAYDDSDTSGDGLINASDANWDANGNDHMFIQAQGSVANQSSRIIAEVRRDYVNTSFPRGIALFTGGSLLSNGGDKDKIGVENAGGLTSVVGYVGGSLDNPEIFSDTVSPVVPPDTPSLDSLMPDSLVNQIVAMAQGMGRYYDLTGGGSLPADGSGITVIKVNDGAEVRLDDMMLPSTHTINTAAEPGIMIILGGPNVHVTTGGTADFYGVLFTDGYFESAHGTPAIHGMLVCKSYLDMRGTADVVYNDDAIMKLANRWTLAVKQVPNTWREVRPIYP